MRNKPNNYRGLLIAFIGPDGSGKTSTISNLKLSNPGLLYTSEPFSDSSVGDPAVDASERITLATIDRRRHTSMVIIPALRRGETVITDRYFACTAAYSGKTRAGAEVVLRAQRALFPAPDLWVYLQTPRRTRTARCEARQDLAFAYDDGPSILYKHLMTSGHLSPVLIIDGSLDVMERARIVRQALRRRFHMRTQDSD